MGIVAEMGRKEKGEWGVKGGCYSEAMYTLFYRPTCPYCHKVLNAGESLGVEFDLRNIAEEDHRAELVARGGKQQVPFLVDEQKGVEMYESDDIVEYLERAVATAA